MGMCAPTRLGSFHEARLNSPPLFLSQFSKLPSRFIQPGGLASLLVFATHSWGEASGTELFV